MNQDFAESGWFIFILCWCRHDAKRGRISLRVDHSNDATIQMTRSDILPRETVVKLEKWKKNCFGGLGLPTTFLLVSCGFIRPPTFPLLSRPSPQHASTSDFHHVAALCQQQKQRHAHVRQGPPVTHSQDHLTGGSTMTSHTSRSTMWMHTPHREWSGQRQ